MLFRRLYENDAVCANAKMSVADACHKPWLFFFRHDFLLPLVNQYEVVARTVHLNKLN
jgi:hypothetical protein